MRRHTFLTILALGLGCSFGFGVPTSPAATLADKQARAAELDEQVLEIERKYDDVQERHRGARFELVTITEDAEAKRAELVTTQAQLGTARAQLSTRAVAIYQQGAGTSHIVQIAHAGSFSKFLARLETYARVGEQDSDIVDDVEALKARVAERERSLREAQARQAQVVRRAAADKRTMAGILADRQEKLDSVNSDIRAIMEAQRRAAAAEAARRAREEATAVAAAAAASAATDGDDADSGAGDDPANSSEGSGSDGGSQDGADEGSDDSTGVASDTSSSSSGSAPLPPASGGAASAASAAMSKIGTPYVWAASGPDSFDCSGLVTWAFAQAGRPGLPHSSYALADMGVDVPLGQLQPGDLVFGSGEGHMGIYVGGGSFVHAPRTGDVVKVTSMSDYTITHGRRI